jgi:UDP-3-O-[3-hydroxymyristoyl] glucosamine N-acyltransferase
MILSIGRSGHGDQIAADPPLTLHKSFIMKFPAPVPVSWIAELIGAELIGDATRTVTGINEIHRVEQGDLVFVDHPKYYDTCLHSAAGFIIINAPQPVPPGKTLLVVQQPFEAYLTIVRHFQPFVPAATLIHPTAQIGPRTYIAPGVFIGEHVIIGADCRIHPHVTIMGHTVIGDQVVIQSATVIGSDAFYYNTNKQRERWYRRMESCGRVVIHDHVEIGASCTIDRGVTHDTLIGEGTKLDNMIHIGHDCVIGRNCLIAAQVGIAGGVKVGNGVTLWGQVGVSKTLEIGDHAVILGQSGVTSSIKGGKVYFGLPAEDAAQKRRELVWIKRIPELWDKVMKGAAS